MLHSKEHTWLNAASGFHYHSEKADFFAVRAIFCVQSDSENTKHISDFLILLEASIMGNLIIYYDQM